VRKQENQRIERENQAFAKKLFDNNGYISKKQFDREYFHQTQYKRNITKVKMNKTTRRNLPYNMESMLNKSNQLPPISGMISSKNSLGNNT